jgi:hypothetical protein
MEPWSGKNKKRREYHLLLRLLARRLAAKLPSMASGIRTTLCPASSDYDQAKTEQLRTRVETSVEIKRR